MLIMLAMNYATLSWNPIDLKILRISQLHQRCLARTTLTIKAQI